MTTMDVLSECLIHKIISYLNFQEATKMSHVSKTWRQACLTHPYLEFNLHYVKGDDKKIVDQVMETYSERKILIEKFHLSISVFAPHHPLVFPRMDKWLNIALQNGVKDLSCKVCVPSYPFPIFTFLAADSLTKLVLSGCNLMDHSLSTTQVASCRSLRKLSLTDVRLDDNMLQTLLNCCSLIDDCTIQLCPLLTKIELRNLQNIKSVSISFCNNHSVKIQAPTLQHLSYFGCFQEESPVLDIVECRNLKSLRLTDVRMSEGFLQHLISTSQFLESLILDDVSTGLERFKICGSQSLKFLAIEDCEGLQEIDALNLVSLEYDGDQIPELKKYRQLKKSRIGLDSLKNVNAAWFGEFRKYLSNSTFWSLVSLTFEECNEINTEDLELNRPVATPKVNNLAVYIESSGKYPTLVDALLWSCHPRRLFVKSTIEMISCFMDCLMYMKNSRHSTCHGRKRCNSQLKELKTYKFDSEHQRVELKSGELK